MKNRKGITGILYFRNPNVRIYKKNHMLTQEILDELVSYLKRDKYKNKIHDLQLDHCTDEQGDYIHLIIIRIKKSQMNCGYGSAIMSEIVQVADDHNVRIKLWASNIYRSDLKRLYGFYGKHGFILDTTEKDGNMTYFPSKIYKRKRKYLDN